MLVNNALAGIAVGDFAASAAWYKQLLGRPPDAEPMEGRLVEWNFPEGGVLLVFEEKASAGRSFVTLTVASLEEVLAHLKAGAVAVGERTQTEYVLTATVSDPDGNRVTFAESVSGGQ